MLCTPTICNVAVTKTLIDGGAGLNILSVEAFGLLHIPHGRLLARFHRCSSRRWLRPGS
jgi:hypothetical protein